MNVLPCPFCGSDEIIPNRSITEFFYFCRKCKSKSAIWYKRNSPWISVKDKDKLPDFGVRVLTLNEDNTEHVAWRLTCDIWEHCYCCCYIGKITHWMPLPPLPEEK
jgi:hypothetical protein